MKYTLFFILSSIMYANKNVSSVSNVYIFAETNSFPIKVAISLEDKNKQMVGCNFEKCFKDIPGSSFGKDSIGNIETGEETNETMSLYVRGFQAGDYVFKIYGFDDTRVDIGIDIINEIGREILSESMKEIIEKGKVLIYSFYFDPTPGAPPPVLTKVVTFQMLRDDFNVAQKLNQIGDDKFVKSLIRMVDIAEMISKRCDNIKDKAKPKCYRPVVVILRMIVKRLEVVNRLCDNQTDCKPKCKVSKECDEDEALKMFESKYRKDKDLTEFFDSWDKDEWHKHKKQCKKFVTDEALEIISSEINWLIKGFGEEVWKEYKENHKPYIPEKYKKFFK